MEDNPDDMGFLAEDACHRLASMIMRGSNARREDVVAALRSFMHEAKKGRPK